MTRRRRALTISSVVLVVLLVGSATAGIVASNRSDRDVTAGDATGLGRETGPGEMSSASEDPARVAGLSMKPCFAELDDAPALPPTDGVVDIGNLHGGRSVLTADLSTWTLGAGSWNEAALPVPLGLEGMDVRADAVYAGPDGSIAIGSGDNIVPLVWRTNDGVDWDPQILPVPDDTNADTATAVWHGDRWIIAGSLEGEPYQPAIWSIDPDGSVEYEGLLPEPEHQTGTIVSVGSMVSDGDEVIVLGENWYQGDERIRAQQQVWSSRDGSTWSIAQSVVLTGENIGISDLLVVRGTVIGVGLEYPPPQPTPPSYTKPILQLWIMDEAGEWHDPPSLEREIPGGEISIEDVSIVDEETLAVIAFERLGSGTDHRRMLGVLSLVDRCDEDGARVASALRPMDDVPDPAGGASAAGEPGRGEQPSESLAEHGDGGDTNKIALWWSLNDACRGGPPDEAATAVACNRRDRLSQDLGTAGWCIAHKDGHGVEWHRPCQDDSVPP